MITSETLFVGDFDPPFNPSSTPVRQIHSRGAFIVALVRSRSPLADSFARVPQRTLSLSKMVRARSIRQLGVIRALNQHAR